MKQLRVLNHLCLLVFFCSSVMMTSCNNQGGAHDGTAGDALLKKAASLGLEGKALELFPKAEAGDVQAQIDLADCYFNAIGCKSDTLEAFNWAKKAANQGNCCALAMVGMFYSNGIGTVKNDSLAKESYQKAFDIAKSLAEKEDAQGVGTLGTLCLYGADGVVAQDVERGISLLKKAAQLGDIRAMNTLIVKYNELQDYDMMVKYTKDAAAKGGVLGIYNLGIFYRDGTGLPKDTTMAVEFFKKAAQQGLARAKHSLAVCYEDGAGGLPQDYGKAVRLYQEVVKQGSLEAKNNLGLCYLNGKGVPQDYEKAVQLFQEVANKYPQAKCNLGSCYLEGKGVPQDYAKAVKLLQESASQGCVQAIYGLAICYESGRGVPLDLITAAKLYQLAASYGHEGAREALKDYGL